MSYGRKAALYTHSIQFMVRGKIQSSKNDSSFFGTYLLSKSTKPWSFFARTPLKLLNFLLKCANQVTEIVLFVILVGQTVHVLSSSEKRFINHRHLLIKWIVYLLVLMMVHHIKHHTILDELFILLCNTFAAILVYPSEFMKNLHLKYFSYNQKKKYDQSIDDPQSYQSTLVTRLIISLSIFSLRFTKILITLIPLNQRRKVELAMKEVNTAIVEEQYIGKIYDPAWKMENQQLRYSEENEVGENMTKSTKSKSSSRPQKAKNTIKMRVDEHIEINLATILSSEAGRRKFTFYRQIQICYNAQTTELTVQQNGRSSTQLLQQVVIIDELMVQLISEQGQESMFIKFKSKKDKELFINYIYLQS